MIKRSGDDEKYTYYNSDGSEIWCYGDIKWNSNFVITCDDEDGDGIAADIESEVYDTWDKVCEYLNENYPYKVEQIETC